MDINVVITTHLVANKASLSYLAAKIAAVAPAGIPVIRTLIPSDVASSPSPTTSAAAGRMIRRNTENMAVSLLKIVVIFTSAKIVPTISIVRALLQFPRYFTVAVMTAGSFTCVTMQIKPR